MFNNTEGYVSNLPVEIQEFYTDELRSVAEVDTEGEPVLIEEEYTYTQDEEEITSTRMVQSYVGVNYVVEDPRYDLKSWTTVENVTDPTFKTYCIEKACEAERWDYHDLYIAWLEREPDKDSLDYYVDGVDYSEELYQAAVDAWEFTVPADESTDVNEAIASMHCDAAVLTRMDVIYSDLLYEGVYFQMGKGKDDVYGITNFRDALTSFQLMGDTSSSVKWIASDNTVYNLKYEDIKAIVLAFNDRKQSTFNSYSEWRAGDNLTAFVVDI